MELLQVKYTILWLNDLIEDDAIKEELTRYCAMKMVANNVHFTVINSNNLLANSSTINN